MKKDFGFVKIGCDPELFVYDTETSRFVSAHDLIPGTKQEPRRVPLGAIQRDGVAAEFNIDPARNRGEFMRNIRNVRDILEAAIRRQNPHYQLVAKPTATFDPEYFFKLPEETLALGCEPDFSAYTMGPNPKPHTFEPFRTGSGHVHIQFVEDGKLANNVLEEEHMTKCAQLSKALDVTLLPLSKLWDNDDKRAELYGKPGAFRPKPYGVEYRSLSNAWLNHTWSQMLVHDLTKSVTVALLAGNDLASIVTEKMAGTNKSIRTLCRVLAAENLPTAWDYAPEMVPQEI